MLKLFKACVVSMFLFACAPKTQYWQEVVLPNVNKTNISEQVETYIQWNIEIDGDNQYLLNKSLRFEKAGVFAIVYRANQQVKVDCLTSGNITLTCEQDNGLFKISCENMDFYIKCNK